MYFSPRNKPATTSQKSENTLVRRRKWFRSLKIQKEKRQSQTGIIRMQHPSTCCSIWFVCRPPAYRIHHPFLTPLVLRFTTCATDCSRRPFSAFFSAKKNYIGIKSETDVLFGTFGTYVPPLCRDFDWKYVFDWNMMSEFRLCSDNEIVLRCTILY